MSIHQMQSLVIADRTGGSITMNSHHEGVVLTAQEIDNTSPVGFAIADVVINKTTAPELIAYLKSVFSL